jgi:hypothetical protein
MEKKIGLITSFIATALMYFFFSVLAGISQTVYVGALGTLVDYIKIRRSTPEENVLTVGYYMVIARFFISLTLIAYLFKINQQIIYFSIPLLVELGILYEFSRISKGYKFFLPNRWFHRRGSTPKQ